MQFEPGNGSRLASFDIEIAAVIGADVEDWAQQPDLGISCAAVAFSDRDDVKIWQGIPRLNQAEAREIVADLSELVRQGYTLVTWNGCGFDFRVLADESGEHEQAAQLALRHVDMMLMVTFAKGWYLGLQKALEGAGLPGKLKTVELSDGRLLTDMDGSKAPLLWAQGEHQAVLKYLEQDVRQQLALAQHVLKRGRVSWRSNRGNQQSVHFGGLLTVAECFDLPEPDTSWMTDPPSRDQFVAWMD